jgi:oxygen-independent coproporphyrinogen-3 oxidase
LPGDAYVDALLRDLEADLPLVWGRTVSSVYLGGGTPSLFGASLIGRLLDGVRALLPLAPALEITLEANPGTVERDSFSAYRDAGINRVSLGAQSFHAGALSALGRVHGPGDIERSLASLHDAGLDNFNIDIMFGLPGQTIEQARRDIDLALEARPAHLSHYQLTLEPNTAFAAAPPALPGDEDCWSMQEATASRLAAAGLEQYEISAWSLPGRRSRHNVNYWRFGDYLGIGAGAHGKLTLPARGEVRRIVKVRHPRRYLAGERVAVETAIPHCDLAFEYLLNALRLRDGFSLAHLEARTGVARDTVAAPLEEALDRGLLEPFGDGFRPTELGWRFGNDLQALFLPPEEAPKPPKMAC